MNDVRFTPKLAILGIAFTLSAALPALATEVTMYYPVSAGGPIAKAYESLAADFTREHPDIQIKPVFAGDQVETLIKAQTAANAGMAPAMAVLDSTNVFTLVDAGLIKPASSFIRTPSDAATIADIYPAFLSNARIGDTLWSVPFQRSTMILYYNKNAFRDAGLDPEHAPASWDELRAMAAKLTDRDAQGNTTRYAVEIPSSQPDVYWPFQAMVTQAGGTLMSDDGKAVFFDSAASIKALSFWRELVTTGAMPSGITAWGTAPTDFLNQKTAIIWHTTGNLVRLTSEASFPVGVAILPADTRRGTPVGGGNIFFFKGVPEEQSQAAWIFAQWLISPERAAEFSIRTGYIAVRAAAYQTDAMKTYIAQHPSALVARDQLEFAVKALSLFDNAHVHKTLMDQLQSAIRGEATPAAALAKAQATATKLLQPFH